MQDDGPRLPSGALERAPSALITLRQHLQHTAAAAGRGAGGGLGARQHSASELGSPRTAAAGRAAGSGPASTAINAAQAQAVWQSLDDSGL